MYAPQQKVLFALNLLLEGNSIRSTMRLTDLDQNTIMKALVLAGERCERVMARYVVRVPVRDVQVDEIWSFIGKKQKAVTIDDDPNLGDAYCFTAIEKNSKLILNFALGKRNQRTTDLFIEGLRHATVSQHFQITTDGFGPYRTAIPDTLGDRCDLLNSSKSTQLRVKGKPAILPPKSFPRRWSQLSAIPIRSVFARPTLSGKTSA
jgi:IS1 family transposase